MAKVKVDFSKAGGFTVLPEGSYTVKCVKADMVKAKTSGANMVRASFQVQEGRYKGSSIINNFVLSERSVWTLYAYMQAAGLPVKQAEMVVDTDKLLGGVVKITVTNREFNGSLRNNIGAYAPAYDDDDDVDEYDVEDEDEEEEIPAPKPKAKKKPAPVVEDDEDDEEEEAPKPVRKKRATTKAAPKKAPEPVVDDDDDTDDEDDEDDAPAPAPKAKAKKAPAPVEEDDDDDGFSFLEDDDDDE